MVSKSKKKGFSLFTPLIGTTVLIIAIMISALMTTNDVKISHAITSSYEQSNQNFDAELIKAEASIGAFNLFNKFNEKKLPTLFFTETGTSNCYSLLEKDYKNSLNNYLLNNFYDEVSAAISTDANYHVTNRYCAAEGVVDNAKNCISAALGKASQLFTLQQNGNNYNIIFRLVPSSSISSKDLNDSFIVRFTSSYQGDIALSILPRSFTYLTNNGIAGTLHKMAEIHHAFSVAESGGVCHSKTYEQCFNSLSPSSDMDVKVYRDNSGKIETVFVLQNGFSVTLIENGFSSYHIPIREKCEWSYGSIYHPSGLGSTAAALAGYDCSETIS